MSSNRYNYRGVTQALGGQGPQVTSQTWTWRTHGGPGTIFIQSNVGKSVHRELRVDHQDRSSGPPAAGDRLPNTRCDTLRPVILTEKNYAFEKMSLDSRACVYMDQVTVVLYNWYFLQAFNFRYFRTSHDSAKITFLQ